MNKTISPFKYAGKIRANSSKSFAQRAFILALLAKGETIIYNTDESKDVLAIQNCIRQLGAKIIDFEEGLKIIPPIKKQLENVTLNVGESGLALRMLGIVTTLFSTNIYITGEGSILNRSQKQLIEILEQLGFSVTHQNYKLPIQIKGQISNQNLIIDASEGSQVISGLLISLPLLEKSSQIALKNSSSKPYLEMTCKAMMNFGLIIDPNWHKPFPIQGKHSYQGCHYLIEGDWSGAANHLVGAAISGQVQIIGLNSNSTQADAKILTILKEFGAKISIDNTNENQEIITVSQGSVKNTFVFDITDAPDLFPILSILASAAVGKSTITGTNRLLNKESNRLNSISELLKNFSVPYKIGVNVIEIFGTGKIIPIGMIDTFSDHRIAMAAAIGACISTSKIELNGVDCINKSYPKFFEDLQI